MRLLQMLLKTSFKYVNGNLIKSNASKSHLAILVSK